jgi:hypothetical protein
MDEVESKSENKEYKINDVCVIESKSRKVIQTGQNRYL